MKPNKTKVFMTALFIELEKEIARTGNDILLSPYDFSERYNTDSKDYKHLSKCIAKSLKKVGLL